MNSNTCISKVGSETMVILRDREGYYIIKMQQNDITLVNTYAFNKGAPKYVKQILMDIKGETDSNTIMIRTQTLLT